MVLYYFLQCCQCCFNQCWFSISIFGIKQPSFLYYQTFHGSRLIPLFSTTRKEPTRGWTAQLVSVVLHPLSGLEVSAVRSWVVHRPGPPGTLWWHRPCNPRSGRWWSGWCGRPRCWFAGRKSSWWWRAGGKMSPESSWKPSLCSVGLRCGRFAFICCNWIGFCLVLEWMFDMKEVNANLALTYVDRYCVNFDM